MTADFEVFLNDMSDFYPAADWVSGMFEHFHQTGAYRAEDIQRLLGNPSEGLLLTAAPTLEMSYRASNAA